MFPFLQGLLDVPIFGRITALKLLRQQGQKDLLFVLTQRYKFCVLEYDTESGNSNDLYDSPELNGLSENDNRKSEFAIANYILKITRITCTR